MSLINTRRVVNPGETVLEYRDGKLARVLSPGVYREHRRAAYTTVDTRERIVPVALQEILTSDGVPVRVSLSITLAVADAVLFVERSGEPVAVVYLATQIALRTACASVTADELIARTDTFDVEVLKTTAAAAGERVGIEVRSVAVRDVVLPHEIRTAAMELITAKARGQAKLEAARAETAALRSMANAGRLLDAHPALAQLRMVQEMPYGTKVVLAVGTSDTPADD